MIEWHDWTSKVIQFHRLCRRQSCQSLNQIPVQVVLGPIPCGPSIPGIGNLQNLWAASSQKKQKCVTSGCFQKLFSMEALLVVQFTFLKQPRGDRVFKCLYNSFLEHFWNNTIQAYSLGEKSLGSDDHFKQNCSESESIYIPWSQYMFRQILGRRNSTFIHVVESGTDVNLLKKNIYIYIASIALDIF